jgi:hypothetical protein
MSDENVYEGDDCPVAGCTGRMEWGREGECTCHTMRMPPCSVCSEPILVCTLCRYKIDCNDR